LVARLIGQPDGTSMAEPPMAFGHPDHFPKAFFYGWAIEYGK